MSKFSGFTQCVDKLEEEKVKSVHTFEDSNHRAGNLDHKVSKLEEAKEKAKSKLCNMAKKLTSSVKIRYGMEMEYLKKDAKKRDLGEYYYHILEPSVTPQYEPIQS